MEITGIKWTEKTWNVFRARHIGTKKKGWFCTKVNAGCKFCYAETMNKRFGNGLAYSVSNLQQVEFYMAAQKDPARWTEPSLIFVNSMTDFFLPEIPDEFRHQALDIMEANPDHEFQLLTKRPDYMEKFTRIRPLPLNVWAGVTIPSQAEVNRCIDFLNNTVASIRWVSMEPMLSSISFDADHLKVLDQVVVGGESGLHLYDDKHAHNRGLVHYDRAAKVWTPWPHKENWVRYMRDQCIDADVKFFFKQWGGASPNSAGRDLDGQTWNEVPRLPGGRDYINNKFLINSEEKRGTNYGKK